MRLFGIATGNVCRQRTRQVPVDECQAEADANADADDELDHHRIPDALSGHDASGQKQPVDEAEDAHRHQCPPNTAAQRLLGFAEDVPPRCQEQQKRRQIEQQEHRQRLVIPRPGNDAGIPLVERPAHPAVSAGVVGQKDQ